LAVAPTAGAGLELRDLERAIRKLPAEQREVVLLVGHEGMRYEEIATTLGIPIGTIRSRVSRAREKLRQLMDMNETATPPPRKWQHQEAGAEQPDLLCCPGPAVTGHSQARATTAPAASQEHRNVSSRMSPVQLVGESGLRTLGGS
jgi:hypothetical protein